MTQAEIKIYDRNPGLENWTVDVLSFTHDKMESVVGIVNTWLESPNRPVELDHYIMFYFDPKIDTTNVSKPSFPAKSTNSNSPSLSSSSS